MLCKICRTTDPGVFYKSIGTYCREHWKERVKAQRIARIDEVRAYDRARASMPHRKAHTRKVTALWRAKWPKRRAAQIALGNAVRSGKVTPLPCFVCGDKSEAHHPDYDAPLAVVWLCPAHHKQAHAMVRETA